WAVRGTHHSPDPDPDVLPQAHAQWSISLRLASGAGLVCWTLGDTYSWVSGDKWSSTTIGDRCAVTSAMMFSLPVYTWLCLGVGGTGAWSLPSQYHVHNGAIEQRGYGMMHLLSVGCC